MLHRLLSPLVRGTASTGVRSYFTKASNVLDKVPQSVRIVEVGPRDGLQNEQKFIATPKKVLLIDWLSRCGLQNIESTAFVRPDRIPQMRDSVDVMRRIVRKEGVSYPVLVPNAQGFKDAVAAGVEEIAIFTSASEAFEHRNKNCSVAQSFENFKTFVPEALEKGIRVRGYVSCVISCPYEGKVAPAKVGEVTAKLAELGCYEVSLGDTIGVGTPGTVSHMLEAVVANVPCSMLAGHYHDTFGQALANILTSMSFGVQTFDSSVGGLGGCPYARGATGNVATEDVVYMMHGLGIDTGVDLEELVNVADYICYEVGKKPMSRVGTAMLNTRKHLQYVDRAKRVTQELADEFAEEVTPS